MSKMLKNQLLCRKKKEKMEDEEKKLNSVHIPKMVENSLQ